MEVITGARMAAPGRNGREFSMDLQFPVLFIRPGVIFYVPKEVSSCTLQAYEEGCYRDLCVYDSSGGLWGVLDAAPVSQLSWLYRLLPWRRFQVELQLSDRRDIEMRAVVAWLLGTLDCMLASNDLSDYINTRFWRTQVVEEFRAKLRAATSPLQLINLARMPLSQ